MFSELHPAMPCLPEGGSRRSVDVGPSRVSATSRLEARPPVTGATATATATAVAAAAAAAKSTVGGPLHRSFCQFGNERLEFFVENGKATKKQTKKPWLFVEYKSNSNNRPEIEINNWKEERKQKRQMIETFCRGLEFIRKPQKKTKQMDQIRLECVRVSACVYPCVKVCDWNTKCQCRVCVYLSARVCVCVRKKINYSI